MAAINLITRYMTYIAYYTLCKGTEIEIFYQLITPSYQNRHKKINEQLRSVLYLKNIRAIIVVCKCMSSMEWTKTDQMLSQEYVRVS